MKKLTNIKFPFSWCDYCPMQDVKSVKIFSDGACYAVVTECIHEELCMAVEEVKTKYRKEEE